MKLFGIPITTGEYLSMAADGTSEFLDKISTRRVVKVLGWLIVAAFGALSATYITYFVQFHGKLSHDHDKWGQFGDFVGGTVNPVLGFLTFISLVFTLLLQTRQLELSREELVETRASLKQANEDQAAARKLAEEQLLQAERAARAQETAAVAQGATARAQASAAAAQTVTADAIGRQAIANEIFARAQVLNAELASALDVLMDASLLGLDGRAKLDARARYLHLSAELNRLSERFVR